MRKLIITTLKSLAQLFQIPSESSGGCYVALDVNVKVYRLILKNCLYSTESDSGCSNQTNLRRNTPLRKRPTGLESACAPADIVPLTIFQFCLQKLNERPYF